MIKKRGFKTYEEAVKEAEALLWKNRDGEELTTIEHTRKDNEGEPLPFAYIEDKETGATAYISSIFKEQGYNLIFLSGDEAKASNRTYPFRDVDKESIPFLMAPLSVTAGTLKHRLPALPSQSPPRSLQYRSPTHAGKPAPSRLTFFVRRRPPLWTKNPAPARPPSPTTRATCMPRCRLATSAGCATTSGPPPRPQREPTLFRRRAPPIPTRASKPAGTTTTPPRMRR